MKPASPKQFKKKPIRAKPVDREGLEQAALMEELRVRMPAVADLIYHVPNGGHRLKSVAVKLKQQGVVAGIPDLVLTMARGGYFGLYIEFKATPPNDATISASQHERIRKLNAQGYLAWCAVGTSMRWSRSALPTTCSNRGGRMTSAAVKMSDAEIKRQAAGAVRDLRDTDNRGLYLRFAKDRARASWYLVLKGKWNLVGNFPDLNTKQVVAALPAIRLRLDAGTGSNLSKWLLTGELLDWYADRMARDRSLSSKRKKTGASLIKCHLKPLLGAVPLASIDKATLDDQFMWPAQESIGIDYVRSAFQLLALAFRQAFKLRLIAANPMKDVKFSDFSKAKVGVKPSRLRVTQLQDLVNQLRDAMVGARRMPCSP